MKRLLDVVLVLCLSFVSQGCYTLKSAAIPPDMRTINVGFFENDATLVVSTLSQTFTEALKDRIRTTTRLSIVNGEGSANMSGAIVGYSIAPVSIQATTGNQRPIAGAEALTISVRVKFVYDADKKLNFDQVFSKSINFSGDINGREQSLITDATKQLIDDIFNRAFNNW